MDRHPTARARDRHGPRTGCPRAHRRRAQRDRRRPVHRPRRPGQGARHHDGRRLGAGTALRHPVDRRPLVDVDAHAHPVRRDRRGDAGDRTGHGARRPGGDRRVGRTGRRALRRHINRTAAPLPPTSAERWRSLLELVGRVDEFEEWTDGSTDDDAFRYHLSYVTASPDKFTAQPAGCSRIAAQECDPDDRL